LFECIVQNFGFHKTFEIEEISAFEVFFCFGKDCGEDFEGRFEEWLF